MAQAKVVRVQHHSVARISTEFVLIEFNGHKINFGSDGRIILRSVKDLQLCPNVSVAGVFVGNKVDVTKQYYDKFTFIIILTYQILILHHNGVS